MHASHYGTMQPYVHAVYIINVPILSPIKCYDLFIACKVCPFTVLFTILCSMYAGTYVMEDDRIGYSRV